MLEQSLILPSETTCCQVLKRLHSLQQKYQPIIPRHMHFLRLTALREHSLPEGLITVLRDPCQYYPGSKVWLTIYLFSCSRRNRSEHKTPLRSRAAISLLQKAQRQRFIISGITSNCICFKSPLFRNPPAARYSRKCIQNKHFKSLPFPAKTIRNWFNESTRSSTVDLSAY